MRGRKKSKIRISSVRIYAHRSKLVCRLVIESGSPLPRLISAIVVVVDMRHIRERGDNLAHTVVVDIVVVEDKAGRMGCILLVEAAALHNRTGDYHMARRASVAGDTPLAGRERSLGQLEAPRKEPVVQCRVRMARPPRPARQVAPPERKRVELRQWPEWEPR